MGKNDKNNQENQVVAIFGDYITLGQLLKFVHIVNEGGMAKTYLLTHKVLVNEEADNRRGRKLRPGDKVTLDEGVFLIERK